MELLGVKHTPTYLGAGGPRQYLHAKFPVRANRTKELATTLCKLVGEADDVSYVTHFPLSVCLSGLLTI